MNNSLALSIVDDDGDTITIRATDNTTTISIVGRDLGYHGVILDATQLRALADTLTELADTNDAHARNSAYNTVRDTARDCGVLSPDFARVATRVAGRLTRAEISDASIDGILA